MTPLQKVLRRHQVAAAESLNVLRETDKGAVMMMTCPGGDVAIALWRQLRQIVNETGHWPVILGSTDEMDGFVREPTVYGHTVSSMLADAADLDGAEVLAGLDQDRRAEILAENPDDDPAAAFAGEGPWRDDLLPNNRLLIPFEVVSKKPFKEVAVALVPTAQPWESPIYLALGDWNEFPRPEAQCAVMKRWHDLYGAEIVGATVDTIEMLVPRPPTDRAAALALAREQYIFSPDIVDQGTENLTNLSTNLLNGSCWFFWWD